MILLKGNLVKNLTVSSIYPNPVGKQLNMIISSAKEENITLMISDFAGRIISQKVMSLVAGDNLVLLKTDQLASGYYTLKIICEGGCDAANQKFIKQ